MTPRLIIDTEYRRKREVPHPSQKWVDKARHGEDDILSKILSMRGGNLIHQCMNCGTCSASCSTIRAMDTSPRQLIQMVNRGLYEEALKSNTMWLCVSCSRCEVRCPRNIGTNTIMKLLREIALEERPNSNSIAKKANKMHELFEGQVRKNGRITEMPLAVRFNLPFGVISQLGLGIKMLLRGKVNPVKLPLGCIGMGLEKNEHPERIQYIYEHTIDVKTG